jgi:hypothetical protein
MAEQPVKSLETLIEDVRTQAGFEAALIIDLKGSILAAARADDTMPETVGALLDIALRIAARPEDRAKLADVGESIFFDWDGRQVICRWFTRRKSSEPRLLVVLAPRGKPYKRAVSLLVKETRRLSI